MPTGVTGVDAPPEEMVTIVVSSSEERTMTREDSFGSDMVLASLGTLGAASLKHADPADEIRLSLVGSEMCIRDSMYVMPEMPCESAHLFPVSLDLR